MLIIFYVRHMPRARFDISASLAFLFTQTMTGISSVKSAKTSIVTLFESPSLWFQSQRNAEVVLWRYWDPVVLWCCRLLGLQCFALCFDMTSLLWCCSLVAGRASGLKNLSGGVLALISVWGRVQICMWPSWCHCHWLSLASLKSILVLVPAHSSNLGQSPDGHKMCVCVCVCVCMRACVW